MCTVKPLNTADLGTGKKAAVFRKRRYWESYITYKTLIWDLEMGGGIGRAAVLGGAVFGGAVLGGAVLRGTTVPNYNLTSSSMPPRQSKRTPKKVVHEGFTEDIDNMDDPGTF